ncbi:hypothetical protein HPB51_007815 [Rhipicephalus microplus]|uniref:Uncharacterized protein n=1 Tax=Rhipicephalus microplus TaxID=6941 RepID=A0A9J6EZF6_RHIMP|nr:hypothetical protein HPB51_007815 [Rhipicephalus microplus]
MEVVAVEGTEITPQDATLKAGWISSHQNKQRKHASEAPASPAGQDSASDTPMLNGSAQCLARKCRQPRLPDKHVKVAIRPRDGLNLSIVGEAYLCDAIQREMDLYATLLKEDIYRTSVETDLIVRPKFSCRRNTASFALDAPRTAEYAIYYGANAGWMRCHPVVVPARKRHYAIRWCILRRFSEKSKLEQQQYLSTTTSTQDAHPERQEVKPSDTRSRSPSPTSKRRGSRSRSKQWRKNQPQEHLSGSAAHEASDGPPPPSAAATQSHPLYPYGKLG